MSERRELFVIIYTKGKGIYAHKTVCTSEAQAGAVQTQVAHMHNCPAWIMSFPEPLEVAND